VTVNCGAIPENLIESELFGYVAGAFTGSGSGGKKGLFEAAQDGTIFLDEISELPLNLQVKLLQVIQERQLTPVGGTKPIPVDVRIISATNRDLESLVREGKFREDLYYRLNVVPINVPPLRERPDDILPLIQRNLVRCNRELGERKTISAGALAVLLKYPWPGNIRELKNAVEYSAMMARDGIIDTRCLPLSITLRNGDIEEYYEEDVSQERLGGGEIEGRLTANQTGDTGASGTETLAELVSAFEKREIKRAIKLADLHLIFIGFCLP
jgi:transcriptional regulator with PAS, ATPase and Fis domain